MAKPTLDQEKPEAMRTADVPMTQQERDTFSKSRRSRSIALALALGAVVVLFYIVSLVKGPGILVRPM